MDEDPLRKVGGIGWVETEGGEIEIAFFGVGIVAVEAIFFEELLMGARKFGGEGELGECEEERKAASGCEKHLFHWD